MRSPASPGPGVQHVDRPDDIQAFPEPARARRPRVESKSQRFVPRPQSRDRIRGQRDRRRDVGQQAAVRPPEPERAVGLGIDAIALLVDRAVVSATEEREVGERGRAALRPVADVMPLAQRQPAAREAAAAVAMVKRAPQRRRNRPRPRPDLHDAPVRVVPHDHAAGVTRQALGRLRGNARPVLEHGLPGLLRVGEHRRVDVHDHLVPLARRTGIERVSKAVSASRPRASACCCALVGASVAASVGALNVRSRRPRWYSVSRAAAKARTRSAPTSGSSRPRSTTVPSSSCQT